MIFWVCFINTNSMGNGPGHFERERYPLNTLFPESLMNYPFTIISSTKKTVNFLPISVGKFQMFSPRCASHTVVVIFTVFMFILVTVFMVMMMVVVMVVAAWLKNTRLG